MSRILVLAAHPDLRLSRVNRRLLDAARALEAEMPQRLAVRDLYALYPDFALDMAAEQAAAVQADLIVWQHPVQWHAMPALMKLWLDEVLAPGWAWGRGGRALAGRELWPVLSTGGVNGQAFEAFLAPYELVAAQCGLRLRAPLVLRGAHAASEATLAEHVARYVEGLRRAGGAPGGRAAEGA